MPRPFTDIAKCKSAEPIKNGTLVVSTTPTGRYQTNNSYVSNTPTITNIQSKYGYRFYSGIFVQLVDGQIVIGG